MGAAPSTNSTANSKEIDLEIEYSPSKCSNRASENDPKTLIDRFEEIHKEETQRVKGLYKSRLNVPYGESERESMDVYFKEEELNTPIFVYVHGGYWVSLDKSVSGICVAPLVERGYRVVVADYNLCPSVTLEKLVQQMKKFIQVLLEYAAGTNTSRISLCGHSAGAHLIATFLQAECLNLPNAGLIKDLFLISGIYDLRELRNTEAVNSENILSLDERSAKRLSPALYNLPKSVRGIHMHVIVAEHDSLTFRRQSEQFYKKLEAQGGPTCFAVLPKYDHFNIIEDMRNEKSLITTYLLSALGGSSAYISK